MQSNSTHGLKVSTICGEAKSVEVEIVKDWKDTELQGLLQQFKPDDIFNADETGLYYKMLRNKTVAVRGGSYRGGKLGKERLTVLVGSKMTNTEKLPLLIVGKCGTVQSALSELCLSRLPQFLVM